jgi:PBP1b-binding outer membrane lipoprotein LpoB
MKHEIKYSVLVAALLAIGLAGCQKKEEAPAPEVAPEMAPEEAPAPMSEPGMSEPGMAPSESMPQEPAPGDMPAETPPSQ